jgi:hypothetical protein
VRLLWIVVVLALATPAYAMKLGRGYELVVVDRQVFVARAHRKAPLDIGATPCCVKTDKDRVSITVQTDCNGETTITFTFDQLEARLVDADARALEARGEHAKAADGFARAARLDPTWGVPAFEVATVLANKGDLTGGAAAIAPWLAARPVQTYARIALDTRLSPLLAAPELAKLRAAHRGSAKIVGGRLAGRAGYSPDLGLAAVEVEQSDGMSCEVRVAIELIDVHTGKVLADLSLSQFDGCGEGPAIPELAAPHQDEQVLTILDDLGIQSTAFEVGSLGSKDDTTRLARFPKAKLGVVAVIGSVRVLRRDTTLATGTLSEPNLVSATYLPDVRLMVLGSYRPSDACPDNAIDAIAMP